MSDSLDKPRVAAEKTLDWVQHHAPSYDLPGLIHAIEAHNTPVYCVRSRLMQALLRWVCACPVGFIPQPGVTAKGRMAACLLMVTEEKASQVRPWQGFFWMPAQLASEGFLLYHLHYWLAARSDASHPAKVTQLQKSVAQLQHLSLTDISRIEDESILQSLNLAVSHELDALSVVKTFILRGKEQFT